MKSVISLSKSDRFEDYSSLLDKQNEFVGITDEQRLKVFQEVVKYLKEADIKRSQKKKSRSRSSSSDSSKRHSRKGGHHRDRSSSEESGEVRVSSKSNKLNQ